MYETFSLEDVAKPNRIQRLLGHRDFTLYKWYTEQDGAFTVIYANFQGADPNEETVEINVRRNCFYPDKTGVKLHHPVRIYRKTGQANTWAPPTAYQEGMIGPHWSKGWIIETVKSLIPNAPVFPSENICSPTMKTSGHQIL